MRLLTVSPLGGAAARSLLDFRCYVVRRRSKRTPTNPCPRRATCLHFLRCSCRSCGPAGRESGSCAVSDSGCGPWGCDLADCDHGDCDPWDCDRGGCGPWGCDRGDSCHEGSCPWDCGHEGCDPWDCDRGGCGPWGWESGRPCVHGFGFESCGLGGSESGACERENDVVNKKYSILSRKQGKYERGKRTSAN